MPYSAVVVAAGRSQRFGGQKKEYRLLDGIPVLAHSLSLFLEDTDCLLCVAVVPPGGEPEARAVLGQAFLDGGGQRLVFAEGGAERAHSVCAGLAALARLGGSDALNAPVLVHDAARPWASRALVRRVLEATARSGAAIPGIQVTDTIKLLDSASLVDRHLKRSMLRAAQTPQGFMLGPLLKAYQTNSEALALLTDDAELWSLNGGLVEVVDGERGNIKITFPEDLA